MTGSAATCNVACGHTAISTCAGGDGCCPAGCGPASDSDCSQTCGNGTIEPGETCDPPRTCPVSCDDNDACTVDAETGSAENCNAACSHASVVSCDAGDGCCPAGCTEATDADCAFVCGNGAVDAGETCDPPSSCPAACDDGDACTQDSLTGDPDACTAQCQHFPIMVCAAGDGCCPAGCTPDVDADCGGSQAGGGAGQEPDGAAEDGCACRSAPGDPGRSWAWALGLVLLVTRTSGRRKGPPSS
jgi:MYXO-CTERM domain-containing protein